MISLILEFALLSRSYNTMSAIMGDSGEPIGIL